MTCKLFTKSAQSSGPENIGPERPLPGLLAPRPVLSPSRITLENNGKIRPQPDRENAFARASGGEEGIRTLETVPPSTPLAGERLRPLGHLSANGYSRPNPRNTRRNPPPTAFSLPSSQTLEMALKGTGKHRLWAKSGQFKKAHTNGVFPHLTTETALEDRVQPARSEWMCSRYRWSHSPKAATKGAVRAFRADRRWPASTPRMSASTA